MGLLRNLRLAPHLAIGFGLVLALLLAVASTAVALMSHINDNVLHYSSDTVPSLSVVAYMRQHVQDMRRLESQQLLGADRAARDKLLQRIDEAQALFLAADAQAREAVARAAHASTSRSVFTSAPTPAPKRKPMPTPNCTGTRAAPLRVPARTTTAAVSTGTQDQWTTF